MLAEAVCQRVDQVPASAVIAQHSLAAVQVQTGGQRGRAQQLRGDRLLAAQGEIDLEGPVDEGPEQLGDPSADDEDDDDDD